MKSTCHAKVAQSTSRTKAAEDAAAPCENLVFGSDSPDMICPAADADDTLPSWKGGG
jgi:hypothetical protein